MENDPLNMLDGLDTLDLLDGPAPKKKKGKGKAADPGTLAEDCREDADEILSGFRARARAEDDRFALATESEYWTCLYFQTREQAEAFAAAVPWIPEGEKYVDGVQVARALGIALPPAKVPYNISNKKDKKLSALTDD